MFIDVIAFIDEATPGAGSPRHVNDVRDDVLRAAIIEGWNVRYGEQLAVSDFDQVFAH